MPDGAGRVMKAKTVRMPTIAGFVQSILGRPVLDKTGLAGVYDVSLTWTPDATQPFASSATSPSIEPAGPSLVTALREQLGLRLESQKVPVELFVIDRSEKPKEN